EPVRHCYRERIPAKCFQSWRPRGERLNKARLEYRGCTPFSQGLIVPHDCARGPWLLFARSHTAEGFERTPMALSFPNKSRAFDATRRAVRFWGYDSAMEVAFFVTEDALKRVQPDMQSNEAGLLRAFDSNWDLICRRAAKIYARGRKGSY